MDFHYHRHRNAALTVNWLIVAAVIFAVNLLPAFGPPTWSLLVFGVLTWRLNAWILVPLAVLSAAAGRYVLAHGVRKIRPHLPRRYVAGLEVAIEKLRKRRRAALTLGALFLVSPLPSAQLFCASGLLDLPLWRVTAYFMVGRLVSYSLYVGGAVGAAASLHLVLGDLWGSPWTISIQAILLLVLSVAPLIFSHQKSS